MGRGPPQKGADRDPKSKSPAPDGTCGAPTRASCDDCTCHNNATAHSRNRQTLGAYPAEPGGLPFVLG